MRILITGADGFTGEHFSRLAKSSGFEVHVLSADLTDQSAVNREVLECRPRLVVHLAAISYVGHSNPMEFYEVNLFGTLNLMAALAQLPEPPAKVVVASSANVYGNCQVSPVSENEPPAPINHYAMSKLAMEHMARAYFMHLPIVITRPFNYTGVGQNERFVIPKLVAHFKTRAPVVELGNLEVAREFNDVRMVCAAYLGLLQIGAPGETYNICTGRAFTLHEVINTLTQLTGHQIRVVTDPRLVRNSEIQRLYGSPEKLNNLFSSGNISVPDFTLKETLGAMLADP
jgi:GDP-6-deoxy-D-talose 4-dehydrogenase